MNIEGAVYFSAISASFSNATVIVRIEDTSRADAPARVISEHRVSGVARSPENRDPVPFAIHLPEAEVVSCCSLRVHVDVGSTGEISPGDYVSTQSYPLRSNSSAPHLRVVVEPVG